VRAGRVVEVDAMRWATLSCALGTLWVLDDVAALLGEGGVVNGGVVNGGVVNGAASPAGIERLGAYRARYTRP
jgi:hypothetical protein